MRISDEAAKEIFEHFATVEQCEQAVEVLTENRKQAKEQLDEARADLDAALRRARDGQTALFEAPGKGDE